jgi:S-adenosylmethionine hydrolase
MAAKIPTISLLTDFGTEDHYVASMKGVICRVNPDAHVIDITHQVAPQDILEAAFILRCCFSYFPNLTVHLVVVDPTVASC